MTLKPEPTMTVEAFLDWSQRQPSGKFELVDGVVVAMAPEQVRHARTKFATVAALKAATAAAGLPCEALIDGAGVRTAGVSVRIPDALVTCGTMLDETALLVDGPMVLVDVLSPSTLRTDTGYKLAEYFDLPSVQHYLLVDPQHRRVTQHARAGTDIRTRILTEGTVDLTPPGFSVAVEAMFG